VTSILEAALEWVKGDPDPDTSAALARMIDENDTEALAAAMGAPLTFGTAGIRGVVGPGPGQMNRALVIKTTAGVIGQLNATGRGGLPVVLGYDARPTSRVFAEDTAGVLAAAGFRVHYFPDVAPTPLVAFAAKTMGAGAAVVVTASHNPPADNGYKVYGANAAQIIPPDDAEIAERIAATPAAARVPRLLDAFSGSDLVTPIGPEMFDAYMAEVDDSRPVPGPSRLSIAYTPMHGVGGRYVKTMFERAGHIGLHPVASQFEPDGTFPTVIFPNPEEEGALDLCHDLAERIGADAILANDPDADRLAAAVAVGDGWRQLTGNELGALLGDYVLREWDGPARAIVASSIVSSPILGRLADRYGAHHELTLTGFKWIVNAALALEDQGVGQFAFGFEEALGYTIGRTVRDKDGMSAALVFSDLITGLAAEGKTGVDRLHEIWAETGLWVSAQFSIVRPGPAGHEEIVGAVNRLGDSPPAEMLGNVVTRVVDYRVGEESRPYWLGAQDLIELEFGEEGRMLVRPSGTEPKLKIYVDLCKDPGQVPDVSHRESLVEARRLAAAMGEWLAP
jgi:phosphomannomutase